MLPFLKNIDRKKRVRGCGFFEPKQGKCFQCVSKFEENSLAICFQKSVNRDDGCSFEEEKVRGSMELLLSKKHQE